MEIHPGVRTEGVNDGATGANATRESILEVCVDTWALGVVRCAYVARVSLGEAVGLYRYTVSQLCAVKGPRLSSVCALTAQVGSA